MCSNNKKIGRLRPSYHKPSARKTVVQYWRVDYRLDLSQIEVPIIVNKSQLKNNVAQNIDQTELFLTYFILKSFSISLIFANENKINKIIIDAPYTW